MERRRTFKVNKNKNKKKQKQKQIQKTKKQTNKHTNQNKTKIYKQANEEYITHAQWNIVRNFS